jgi:hypothetical protein
MPSGERNPGASGQDKFTQTVTDGKGGTDPRTVRVRVTK